MSLRAILVASLLIGCAAARADDLPDAQDLADATAQRFPQPVRVGDLLHRAVLEPAESRDWVGRVRAVVKQSDGTVAVVLDYGGVWGFFTRPIAVPANAMVLVGQDMEIAEYEPDQVKQLPTFNPAGSQPLPPNSIIRMGLAKPSH